jgi:hypothetical protein
VKRALKALGYLGYLAVISAACVYLALIVMSSVKFYEFVKKPHSGWEGAVHTADGMLGYKPIPGAIGYEVYENGKRIVLQYDDHGFRVPAKWAPLDLSKKPVLLFLGDSFTYGSACLAEETYPYLVGRDIGGTAINAGTISYGFSQMAVFAEKLIPEFKPDLVFVQISPWLLTRPMNMYRQAPYGVLPMPYFSKVKGGIKVMPPPYVSKIFDVPVSRYQNEKKGAVEFLCFLRDVGFPFYAHDIFERAWARAKICLGLLPAPTKDATAIERYFYSLVYDSCIRNKAVMVMVFLGTSGEDFKNRERNLGSLSNMIMADAESLLWESLKVKTQKEYDLNYKHVTKDGRLIDKHPSPAAHRIIAAAIEEAIARKIKEKK